MARSPKLQFDHSFILYYNCYDYKLKIIGLYIWLRIYPYQACSIIVKKIGQIIGKKL
jgi:hypothetical protein